MKKITETITYNIYEFDELNKEVREEVINRELENEKNFYCELSLYNDMLEKTEDILKDYCKSNKLDYELKAIYYDLSYSQGSGAMIECSIYKNGRYITFKQFGHYSHEQSFRIDYNINEKLKDKIVNDMIILNKALRDYGYNNIEYYYKDEYKNELIERLKNDYEFLEDGSIY